MSQASQRNEYASCHSPLPAVAGLHGRAVTARVAQSTTRAEKSMCAICPSPPYNSLERAQDDFAVAELGLGTAPAFPRVRCPPLALHEKDGRLLPRFFLILPPSTLGISAH